MNDTIKAIATELCDLAGDCGRCNMDGCGPLLIARAIYTAHVKPLENALAQAETDLKGCMEIAAERASRAGGVRQGRDKERVLRLKAEADKEVLVEALEACCGVLEEQHTDRQYMALVKTRAALARVKGEA